MKICSQCGVAKLLSEFPFAKTCKDGVRKFCKTCDKTRDRTGGKSAEEIKAQRKIIHKNWFAKNKDNKLTQNKIWRQNNVEYIRNYHKNYERLKRKNPIYRLHQAISIALRTEMKGKKHSRKWNELLGYSDLELKLHLESKFLPGMVWDNYGKWHIDHVRPLSSFKNIDNENHPDFKQCWALSNLQPLWAIDNINKGAKL